MSLENLTLIKVRDAVRQCEQKNSPKFIGFLTEAELGSIIPFLKKEKVKYCCFGGYSEASNVFLCIMPEWLEEENVVFPISIIEFGYRTNVLLTHRDFLGTVMALGITRNSIGDILVDSQKTYMFVAESISEYIISQVSKVGSVGVTVKLSNETSFNYVAKMSEHTETVASLRLDCVVAALCNCGRKKACELIESGCVILNSSVIKKCTSLIKQNSIISVRKFGKFIIDDCSGFTKKQRIVLKYKKYL